MPTDTRPLPETIFIDADESPPAPAPSSPPRPAHRLDTNVAVTMGELSFTSQGQTHTLEFQFNPTEMERSRTVKVTRTPTGNTLEEERDTTRDKPKRKASRKPDPWDLTLALKFDAGYYHRRHNTPALSVPFGQQVDRIANAIHFFEALVDPAHHDHENENVSNANETPPPPYLFLQFGKRRWKCFVK